MLNTKGKNTERQLDSKQQQKKEGGENKKMTASNQILKKGVFM